MPSADVLYVLRYWPTVSETFVAREIGEVLRRGVGVTVISMGRREDSALADGLPMVETLDLPRGRALARSAVRTPGASKLGVRVRWAVQAARRRGVERVHAHFAGEAAVFARLVADRLGVPFSVTVHARDLFAPIAGLPGLLRAADPCITVCAHHQAVLFERYGVRARVVRCGIVAEGRPAADPSVQPARVVCVARDVEKKGLDRLVRAVPTGQLDLVGANEPVPPSRIPGRLARAQLFALPAQVATSGDRDGVPVAMMEAMAAGLPVVTRPVSGIPELVDERVGWIDEDFESALADALARPEERVKRGCAGRERVLRAWRLDEGVDHLLEAWGRLQA